MSKSMLVLALLLAAMNSYADSGDRGCVTVREIKGDTGNKIVRLSNEFLGVKSGFWDRRAGDASSNSIHDYEVIPTTQAAVQTMAKLNVGDKVCLVGSAVKLFSLPNIQFFFYAVSAE